MYKLRKDEHHCLSPRSAPRNIGWNTGFIEPHRPLISFLTLPLWLLEIPQKFPRELHLPASEGQNPLAKRDAKSNDPKLLDKTFFLHSEFIKIFPFSSDIHGRGHGK